MIPYSKSLYCLVHSGLASRPFAPEGRESILTYSRDSKSWVSTSDFLPSVDEFFQGITASRKETDTPE
jgi:hypothetical protein